MLILAGTLVAIALVPLLGGRLSRLATVPLLSRWLVVYALALQVLAISVIPGWSRPGVVALHASSYVLAGAFVWRNRHVAGLPLIALGAGSNALAIALNGGQMPASASALAAVGISQEPGRYVNSGVVAHPRLPFLGDVFPSPSWLPLHNVYSVGDLLILAGAVWLVHRTCGSALARRPHCPQCAAPLGLAALRQPAAVVPGQRTAPRSTPAQRLRRPAPTTGPAARSVSPHTAAERPGLPG